MVDVEGDKILPLPLFQSPRSGQICLNPIRNTQIWCKNTFQSPRSGQICSNLFNEQVPKDRYMFQSPRSGQICSNEIQRFIVTVIQNRFNPLDRVKFVQILEVATDSFETLEQFQSPRSGQICSNLS